MITSGILLIDKPQGVTSHDIVAACRSLLHNSKVGHAGTLDPMATGMLVVGFGSATRLLNSIVGTEKTYETTIRLGNRTQTDDADGALIERSPEDDDIVRQRLRQLVQLDEETSESNLTDTSNSTDAPGSNRTALRNRIESEISQHLLGQIEQIPSTYSAKKIDGKRAYDLARKGEDVTLTPQKITIHRFDVTDIRLADDGCIDVDACVTCSAGTYIRALGRDLGELLGVGGYLTMLRRTRVGQFDVQSQRVIEFFAQERTFTNRDGEEVSRMKAYAPSEIRESDDALAQHIMTPYEAACMTVPTVELTDKQAIDVSFGRPIECDIAENSAAVYRGILMALLEPWRKHRVKPSTVFVTAAELADIVERGDVSVSTDTV